MTSTSKDEITEFLISGGYATIYINRKKNIVYKVFYNPHVISTLHSWLREIMFLPQLNHPNIIKIIDVRFDHPLIYSTLPPSRSPPSNLTITYPYYKCISDRKDFSDRDIFVCLKDLFDGINYCHYMGIIHRDIKQNNLFYTERKNSSIEKLIIGDFGLANVAINQNDSKIITYTHNSPEIFRGGAHNEKSEVWSCAVCLIYFITGVSMYDLSIYDASLTKMYHKYIRNNQSENKIQLNKNLHKLMINSKNFKEKIICLINCNYSSNIKNKHVPFYKFLLNIMLEHNPSERTNIMDLKNILLNYIINNKDLKIEIDTKSTENNIKRTVCIPDWKESICLPKNLDKKSMGIIKNILRKYNMSYVQERYLINKTIKLIDVYISTCYDNEKALIQYEEKSMISCLYIIILTSFYKDIKITLCDDIVSAILDVVKSMDFMKNCNFMFPIPNLI